MSLVGKILYKLYYAPRNRKHIINRFGGIENYNIILDSERRMKDYALTTLTLKCPINKDGRFSLNFLTGEKYLHQTLFCIYSFFEYLSREETNDFSVTLFDDGSLNADNIARVNESFPGISIILYNVSIENINTALPKDKFPFIHKKIKDLVLFNKIFFLHAKAQSGLKIYLDSDMLFIKRPEEVITWLYKNHADKNKAFGLEDIKRSYGYSDDVLKKVGINSLNHKINAGMYAIHSENIDFNFIESKIKELEEDHGPSYYMEQFITSILLTQQDLYILPKELYIVFHTKNDVLEQKGILHHYVDISKEYYFKHAWRTYSP